MNELDFAEETLIRMKALYDLAGDHEEIRRAVVSRLYYAAHHLSRLLLRKSGLRTEAWRKNVHQRVIGELGRRFAETGRMDHEIFASLDTMRRLRVRADYQLHRVITESNVENTIGMFDAYFGECKRLLEGII